MNELQAWLIDSRYRIADEFIEGESFEHIIKNAYDIITRKCPESNPDEFELFFKYDNALEYIDSNQYSSSFE